MKSMQKATFFLCFVFLLGAACFTLSAISLGTSRWRFVISRMEEFGLFERCQFARPAGSTCVRSPTEL